MALIKTVPRPFESDKIPFRLLMKTFLRFLLCACLTLPLAAQKRKGKNEEEPKPQVLPALPDLPEALTVETARLSFHVSPLSDKGLLSQQVRDALKTAIAASRGGAIVRIRAFVAGSGDLRRVKDIVAEEFTEHKLALPVVSTLQAGALPLLGAQVVLESAIEEKKTEKKIANPNGLALLSGVAAKEPAAAIAQLQQSSRGAGVEKMLRVTCFLSSLSDAALMRPGLAAAFPGAAVNLIQPQRLAFEQQTTCEGIGRLTAPPSAAIATTKDGALVNAPKLVLTETQLVFRDQDSDFQLAFQRLAKTLASQQVSPKDVVWMGTYALTLPNAAKLQNAEKNFLDHAPAGVSLLIEGLPSTDATAAVEVIAVRN